MADKSSNAGGKNKWRIDTRALDRSALPNGAAADKIIKKTIPNPRGFQYFAHEQDVSAKHPTTAQTAKHTKVPATNSRNEIDLEKLKLRKMWDMALSPAKSIPMQAFMLWMSGNSIQIFSILITVMLFWNSIKAILGVHAMFARFASATGITSADNSNADVSFVTGMLELPSDPWVLQKLAFIGMQLVLMGLGVWKCNAMGLLPTSSSDWLAFEIPKGTDILLSRYVGLSEM